MLHEFIIQLQCLALCLYLSVRLSVESVVKVMRLKILSLVVLWVCLSLGDVSSQSCVGEQSLVCGEDGVTYANECYAKKA